MSKIDRLLSPAAAAALLPLLLYAGPASAGTPQRSAAQPARAHGDPDSGGEFRPRPRRNVAITSPVTLADNGGGPIVRGPGGGTPPVRPRVVSPTMLADGGTPIVRGSGGGGTGKPPKLTDRASLEMASNDGNPVGGPGGSGKPPIRPNVSRPA